MALLVWTNGKVRSDVELNIVSCRLATNAYESVQWSTKGTLYV